ncbi:hypothetical protein [Burkholderia dolosa]|jgi:hypothetical protein|nr:hypothetical protein [Burkholderia dolosa]
MKLERRPGMLLGASAYAHARDSYGSGGNPRASGDVAQRQPGC